MKHVLGGVLFILTSLGSLAGLILLCQALGINPLLVMSCAAVVWALWAVWQFITGRWTTSV